MAKYIALLVSLLILVAGFYFDSVLVVIVSLFFLGFSLAKLWDKEETT